MQRFATGSRAFVHSRDHRMLGLRPFSTLRPEACAFYLAGRR